MCILTIKNESYKYEQLLQEINENEFLDEYTVRKGDWGVLDPLTGTADVGKGTDFSIEDDKLVTTDDFVLV